MIGMDFRVVPIRQLNDEQIVELAELHKDVIHSLLTDLGLPFLEKYYRIACADENAIGFCALSENNMPVGWVVGSPKPEHLNNQLNQPVFWFIFQVLRVVTTHPLLLWQLFISARSASVGLERDQIELTYIGVASSARRMGLGRTLTDAFLQACKGQYHSAVLSVEVENMNAIQLYTTFGFQIVNTLTEGKFKRHRMELKL